MQQNDGRISIQSGPNSERLKDAFFAVNDGDRQVSFGTAEGNVVLQITSLDRRTDGSVIVWSFLAQSLGPETQWFKGYYRIDMKGCWLEPLP